MPLQFNAILSTQYLSAGIWYFQCVCKSENKQNIKISFEKNSLPSEWELMLSFPAEPVETRKL